MTDLVVDRIVYSWGKISIDLEFESRITILNGDSAIGKSLIWQAIQNWDGMNYGVDRKVSCYNTYTELGEFIPGRLIVIDNIELLIDKDVANRILKTNECQFLLIGKNRFFNSLSSESFKTIKTKDNKLIFVKSEDLA